MTVLPPLRMRFGFAGILSALCISALAYAQPRPHAHEIFRLGEFDGSSYEFSQATPQGPVTLHPDKLGAVDGWFAFQPAVQRQAAGAKC